jgi:hypothetical protein
LNASVDKYIQELNAGMRPQGIEQERMAQTEAMAEASFAARKKASAAAVPVKVPTTTNDIFRNVVASRKKPVIQVNLSRAFFPAAKATERELQRK